jgi:hypothetical protein
LAEVVFQFLRNRGDLVALAVHGRFARSRASVLIAPELTLTTPNNETRELDFAVTEGSRLFLGEAFTGSRYEKGGAGSEMERLRRLAEIALLFNAYGVILATAADHVADRTTEHANTAFAGHPSRLEVRERATLLPRPRQILGDALP